MTTMNQILAKLQLWLIFFEFDLCYGSQVEKYIGFPKVNLKYCDCMTYAFQSQSTLYSCLNVPLRSGCGFKSCCSHLNFRFRTCFKQGVP